MAAITPRTLRIIEIADELITGMVEQQALDPDDEQALDTACEQAVRDATRAVRYRNRIHQLGNSI